MRKVIAFILCLMIICGAFAGCGGTAENNGKIKIVTTIFPIYDWVKEIVGDTDSTELSMLLDNGVDLHSFQPTADDIVSISTCDMFIYVGGESDEWVTDALKEATNKNLVAVNLLDVLGDSVKEEEVKEGMEAEEEEEEGGEEEPEYDEHVWLSVKNAKVLCQYILKQLCKIDSDNQKNYKSNTAAYTAELDKLDNKYSTAVNSADVKTLLFGDRFPFRYLVDDYNLDYYAAFVGCSAESEASFKTIAFLAKKVDELNLKSICKIESSDGKIAQTIKDNTKEKNQEIITFDSMQSTTSKQIKDGTTYLSVMQNNLNALKNALK
ncbi:MAG: metal ABC transporter substrate-binding protein [Ruminococcus sp.]|nr:metal ABC transporter substrate-binding protein [Ruminococcus sp.]